MSARILRMNSGRFGLLVAITVWATFGFAVRYASAQNDDGAGIVVSKRASSADVGLPIYPGAKPHKSPGSDSDAARLGAWGGAFGFGLAVMQLESSDAPTKIAEYYKMALAKYGTVLDCTNGGKVHEDSSSALTCDDKPGKNGGMVFKAGTKKKQHIVEVEPNGSGSTFALVYLWTKGD
jgi:hypothetical protein